MGPLYAPPVHQQPELPELIQERRRESGLARGTAKLEGALFDALAWLAAHQSHDGRWDCDGFDASCGHIGPTLCDGDGHPQHDVGTTALALLAFLGAGATPALEEYGSSIGLGVAWLVSEQDPATGLLGEKSGPKFMYAHAIGTLALCEAHMATGGLYLGEPAQAAVNYLLRARNPYGGWRYSVPAVGDNDTSITGWAVLALAAAAEAGLAVENPAFDGALSWIDHVTDPATGRVGYASIGSLSDRTIANEHYPKERGEAMTAVGMLCRILIASHKAEDISELDILEKHADLLLRTPPEWDRNSFGCDLYYWFFGYQAMFQMGGRYWKEWEGTLDRAVVESQRQDGDEKGSWDPIGPWGFAGGRVYATALMALCLETPFRQPRLIR